MLKKTITFIDYNGAQVTEDYYFNLTKSELAELELGTKGGLEKYLASIITSNDGGLIIETFKMLLQKAYGKKSEDGRRFMKSTEIWLDFLESPAYDNFFIELVTNADAAAAFVNGIMPSDLVQMMEESGNADLNARAEAAIKQLVGDAPTFRPELIQPIRTAAGMPPHPDNKPTEDVNLPQEPVGPLGQKPRRRLSDYTQKELVEMSQEEFLRLTGK